MVSAFGLTPFTCVRSRSVCALRVAAHVVCCMVPVACCMLHVACNGCCRSRRSSVKRGRPIARCRFFFVDMEPDDRRNRAVAASKCAHAAMRRHADATIGRCKQTRRVAPAAPCRAGSAGRPPADRRTGADRTRRCALPVLATKLRCPRATSAWRHAAVQCKPRPCDGRQCNGTSGRSDGARPRAHIYPGGRTGNREARPMGSAVGSRSRPFGSRSACDDAAAHTAAHVRDSGVVGPPS
jgi:hypothetical protein